MRNSMRTAMRDSTTRETLSRWCAMLLFASLIACGGGASDAGPALQEEPTVPDANSDPVPDPLPTPQQPAIDAEVIGFPGDPVPGLDAVYVATLLGWIAPEGDVIFEAVIDWDATRKLGCGILRRTADGRVHTLLMQEQSLAGTGGGVVLHPRLPLEARGDTIVMVADVKGGNITHGLFAVPREGGSPRLLASEDSGVFVSATINDDGSVIAEVARPEGRAIVYIAPDMAPVTLCERCDADYSTDGTCVVIRRDDAAWMIELDGSEERIAGIGDPVPPTFGESGTITGVRGAWINDAGAFVLHLNTDIDARPDFLVRLPSEGGAAQVLAVCGEQAPGLDGTVGEIFVAAGRSEDVVYGATLKDGNGAASAIFCARPGASAQALVASGERVDGVAIAVLQTDIVADQNGHVAFGAALVEGGLVVAHGVYRVAPGKAPERVVTNDALVTATGGAHLRSFLYPLRAGIDVSSDGSTLVHGGLVEARRPDATLGALLLVR